VAMVVSNLSLRIFQSNADAFLFPVYVTFETTISYQTFAIGGSGDTDFGC
jgi:hypothetical protein